MAKLPRKPIQQQIIEEPDEPVEPVETRFDNVVSTGSTLLDCAISCQRTWGGGIPGGILVEIFGPPASGKTAVLEEIGASAQKRGGFFKFADVEQRLDRDYARTYDLHIDEENYTRPERVSDLFDLIWNAPQSKNGAIDVVGVDSIAALLSLRDESEGGDKRGDARAKELHQLMRMTKSRIADKRRLVVLINQTQANPDAGQFASKERTPGGFAPQFYSSLRIRIGPTKGSKMKVERTIQGQKHEKVIAIKSECTIVKSTIDDPWRKVPIYIMFKYGIDDIRANLEFLKRNTKNQALFRSPCGKKFQSVMEAARWVGDDLKLVAQLREETIGLYTQIDSALQIDRPPKVRI